MNVCKSCFLGHIMKISTIYLFIRIDFSLFVDRKLRNITDIKMLRRLLGRKTLPW